MAQEYKIQIFVNLFQTVYNYLYDAQKSWYFEACYCLCDAKYRLLFQLMNINVSSIDVSVGISSNKSPS